MRAIDVLAPQLGEHVWHTFTADTGIATQSDAHRRRIEEAVAAHLPDLDWSRARVLEIGAYRHYTGHLLASRRQCEYVASDIAAPALRDGREQARRSGIAVPATLVVADFHDLPFATDCFDVVFVVASVHHTRRPEVVLREMLRVLRPGGLLVLGDEPCARALCFHAFVCNRAENLTPFETKLDRAGLLPTLSSPFWGARPEHLFGMVENDRIPLSLYLEAFAEAGTVVERTLAEHALVGAFENQLLSLSTHGADLARDVRARLRAAVDEAAAAYGTTERLLGYRLPTECDIHALAARVAPLLEARPAAGRDETWRAHAFGAALSAVVRKRGDARRSPNLFRREMAVEDDGLVRERPGESSLARALASPLLPDLQDVAEAAAIAPWFPPEDWRFVREDNGLRTLANLHAHARIEMASRDSRMLLLMRYYAVVTDARPYRVRVWGCGRLLDEQLIVLSESRLVRAIVPEACAQIVVEIATEDDPAVDPPWRLRVGVCQLFPVDGA
ncbi:MAG: class I SAM-dependent methyltransferase [Burkholderiales bacterium]|nr:class I SAM-dependent methyltransferase [Burkholderiales bacterium]